MKLCPKCKSSFSDETLKFCLQDGTQLITLTDESSYASQSGTNLNREMPTLKMNQLPTLEMTDEEATVERRKSQGSHSAIPPRPQPTRKGGNIILTLGVIIIALCLIALVGIGAAFLAKDFLFANQNAANNSNNINAPTPAKSPKQNPSPSPTPKPSGITVAASSTRAPLKSITYDASFIVDGDLSTAWIEGASGQGIGEWLRCDFGKTVTLKKIIVYPGYFKNESIWAKNNRLSAVKFYFSDGSSLDANFDDTMEPQTVDVGKIKTSYVKLVIESVYDGETDFEDTAVSELNFVFE